MNAQSTQSDAVRVLADLVEADLPGVRWGISPYSGATLDGQPVGGDGDHDVAVLVEWAAHLGVAVEVERRDTYTAHTVSAIVDGVRVRLFAHTDKTHTWVSVPLAEGGAK